MDSFFAQGVDGLWIRKFSCSPNTCTAYWDAVLDRVVREIEYLVSVDNSKSKIIDLIFRDTKSGVKNEGEHNH